MGVEIELLGGFAVRVDGRAVPAEEWRRRQAAALVKLLALAPRRALHREQVIDALWPGDGIDSAAARLHKAAHYARRTLGDPRAMVLAGDIVSLFPDVEVVVDAEVFERSAQQALAATDGPGREAATAADLWSGDLLPEDSYEAWLEEPRERLRLLHQKVLRRAGRWEDLASADPADEDASLAVARKLAGGGDRRGALRQLERLERALRGELGVTPSPAVASLRAELLALDVPHAEGRRPPLGRAPELGRIDRLIVAASNGQGRTLFVSGPAGIGKTVVLRWLDRRAEEHGLRVGFGTAAAIEGAWPYAPVLEALADLCRRHPALLDGLADEYRVEIEGALRGASPDWDGESRHQRLFVSAAELLRLASSSGGAVLVVDDAHDADEASLRLLHYLSRSAVGERIVIVVAHRPWPLRPAMDAMRRSLIGRGTSVPLDLGPLADEDIRQLAGRAVGEDQVLLERVVKLSGGNPFAAVELARTARVGDDRAGPMGALVLRGIGADATAALIRVAVLGGAFDTDEYVALSGVGEARAYVLLDDTLAAGAIEQTSAGYRFRHSLVRDALLDGLPPHRLLPLHRHAAEVLRGLGASPARIGYQLLQAGDVGAAAPFLLQAARTDAAIGAYRDALALIDTVRQEVRDPERGPMLALRADMLMATGDAGAILAYREALGATVDPAEQRRLLPRLARAATFAGDYATAAEALEGLEPNGSADDAALLLQRGILSYLTGDLPAAEAAADEARRRIGVADPGDWRMYDLISLQGLVAHLRGEWFGRLAVELRAGARRPDLARSMFDSHLCVAEFLLYGPTPYAEVLALAATLRESAQRSGVLRAVAFATALRGEAALLSGDLTLAESELTEAAQLHHDIGSTAGEAHSLQRLAEVRLEQGDPAEARRLLHRALPLARWSSIALHLLQRVYGTMIRAAPDADSARAAVDQATAALGQEDSCTFCSIMLAVPAATACADAGDLDDARRYLAAAEKSAALWKGTAWQAAIAEARAHLHSAEGDRDGARRRLLEAAELFAAAGQPLDADRCLT
ncbi:SARP family transcriptional regulator [Kribbella pittospori]|uniref:SARP family transcriptional regulator n=1 Tax=Kribbella pittospori TaxID=722689 RepID=A0A4R0K5F5_9ACTN|nr:AAA family ATPase [Kribbella pittospori]TCC55301.1 SARP family transcriptional regulator [Kribbella pittospori]